MTNVQKCVNKLQHGVDNIQETSEALKETKKDSILLELKSTIMELQENVQSSSTNTMTVQKMQSEVTAVASSLSVDDIVQYELMKSIAKKVGAMPCESDMPFWQIMGDNCWKLKNSQ